MGRLMAAGNARARSSREITCALCGYVFDPRAEEACPSCPLFRGCTLACCPQCGHDTVDPARSRAVLLATSVVQALRSVRPGRRLTPVMPAGGDVGSRPPQTLADVDPGVSALVTGLDGLDHAWRERLQAYGLTAGRAVRVVQHAPLTIVRVEHAEVALETHLARGIAVVPEPAEAAA